MPRPQRIPTGRSWRDLPPHPPSTFVPAPVVDEPLPVAPARKIRIWPFVVGGVGVVLLGFVVGLFLPRSGTDDQAGASASTTTLPEVIVPPAPTTIPSDRTPLTIPDLGTVPAPDVIFSIPTPPEGFRVASNYTRESSERIDQTAVLTDGSADVEVSAWASAADPELPRGDSVTVRGQGGVITRPEDGRITISWIEPGKIFFQIDAPEEFGLEAIIELAESLEVR